MLWHPDAKRQPLEDAGPFTGGRPKLLWHTTEGGTYPGTSIYHGTEPHFTFDFKLGRLYQHVALNRSAKGLEHPAGTGETNHDHVIQVELVDFAARAGLWTSAEYARIAALARWIEANAGVPRSCGVSFANPTRLTWTAFHNYAGHLGPRACAESAAWPYRPRPRLPRGPRRRQHDVVAADTSEASSAPDREAEL
jgi:hypothetical protein